MKCLACGWNADNVSAVSYCPNCGDDLSLIDLDGNSLSTEVEKCLACDVEMLYWQLDRHPCTPQTLPVDNSVDNFLSFSKSLRP